jgi:hypothetical protein
MVTPIPSHSTGCLICGAQLAYAATSTVQRCELCDDAVESTARCEHGHFVCDRCHALPAFDLIERVCGHTDAVDPIDLAMRLMERSAIAMHGPEHHYLVPAVLISCASRVLGEADQIPRRLAEARKRAQRVPGGFCGLSGACGAGIGTGIFVSVMTGATPLSQREWSLSNELTSRALASIAARGGPRCCKRCSILAIQAATEFAEEQLGVSLPRRGGWSCGFHERNRQCREGDCPFFDRE